MKSRVLGCVGTFLALALAASTTLAASTVRKMELSAPAADSARLVLDLSSMPVRKVFTVEKTADKPDRIVIDLSATILASGLRLPEGAGPVRAVRSGVQPGKTLRLVIELSRRLEPAVSISGSQLTVDIGAVPRQLAATAPAPAAVPAAPPPSLAVRAAHAPDDTGRDIIVAVDAGHGGTDPGALGAKGTREKDVTLAMARALAKRIDAEPGMRAYLTRKDDRKIELPDRINLARNARADIFVSIHADSIENRNVAGSSVYVLSERGASSVAAKLLAEHENAVDLKGGISLGDKDNLLASCWWMCPRGPARGRVWKSPSASCHTWIASVPSARPGCSRPVLRC